VRSARSAFQRRLQFPDRRILRTADSVEQKAGVRLTALAHDLEPAVAAVEALRDLAGDWVVGQFE
jgi:hypothetical protein